VPIDVLGLDMTSHRGRLLLATAMTVAGAVMIASNEVTLQAMQGVGWAWVGAGIVVMGLTLAALASLPTGARLAPCLLVLSGGVVFATARGWLATPQRWWVLAGVALIVVGLWLLVLTPVAALESIDPVRSVRTFLVPRRVSFERMPAPGAVRVICMGGVLLVDLSQMVVGKQAPLELSVSAYAGRVELKVPSHWLVVPGRLLGGDTLRLEGRFDDNKPIAYLGSKERKHVTDLARSYSVEAPWEAKTWSLVLNVTGSLSVVAFTRD
jgi:hypothetical protein